MLICSKTEKSRLTGPPVNNDRGMRGMLMSSFIEFITFKSSLFKCSKIIHGLGTIRLVWI